MEITLLLHISPLLIIFLSQHTLKVVLQIHWSVSKFNGRWEDLWELLGWRLTSDVVLKWKYVRKLDRLQCGGGTAFLSAPEISNSIFGGYTSHWTKKWTSIPHSSSEHADPKPEIIDQPVFMNLKWGLESDVLEQEKALKPTSHERDKKRDESSSLPSKQHVLHRPEWVMTSSFFLLVSFSLVVLILQTPREYSQ